jgi:hypothetical protein
LLICSNRLARACLRQADKTRWHTSISENETALSRIAERTECFRLCDLSNEYGPWGNRKDVVCIENWFRDEGLEDITWFFVGGVDRLLRNHA